MAKETELQDVKTGAAPSLLEAAPLNDATGVKKRPARERLALLKVMGGMVRPGYKRRWVIDKRTSSAFGNRITDLETLGYSVVSNEQIGSDKDYASPMGSVVEKFEEKGSRMVLMEISVEDYEEIQEAKAETRAHVVQALEGPGYYKPNLQVTKK